MDGRKRKNERKGRASKTKKTKERSRERVKTYVQKKEERVVRRMVKRSRGDHQEEGYEIATQDLLSELAAVGK